MSELNQNPSLEQLTAMLARYDKGLADIRAAQSDQASALAEGLTNAGIAQGFSSLNFVKAAADTLWGTLGNEFPFLQKLYGAAQSGVKVAVDPSLLAKGAGLSDLGAAAAHVAGGKEQAFGLEILSTTLESGDKAREGDIAGILSSTAKLGEIAAKKMELPEATSGRFGLASTLFGASSDVKKGVEQIHESGEIKDHIKEVGAHAAEFATQKLESLQQVRNHLQAATEWMRSHPGQQLPSDYLSKPILTEGATGMSETGTGVSAHDAASEASQHDQAAAQSAQSATQHETEAGQHAQAAGQNETEAGQHAQAAGQHETEAGQHAQAAGQHETEAGQHAQAAGQHETEAGQHAQAAGQHETEAGQHAQAAGQHETEAGQHAQAAGQHETEAGQHAQAAGQHETEAGQHAQAAGQQEQEAQQHAQAASQHEQESQASSQHISQLASEADQLKAEIDNLRQQSDSLHSEIAHMRDEAADWARAIDELRSHAEQMSHQMDDLLSTAQHATQTAQDHASEAATHASEASACAMRASMYAG